MTENEKYQIIKTVVDTNGNKQKAFFVHGNHAHQPITTIPEDTRLLVLNLYQTKYYEANLTHFQELLYDMENLKLSVSSITSILR